MMKKEKINGIITALADLYPNPVCALIYNKPHELLIAARLSAQCTDKRVNLVTPALFGRYPEIKDFAAADVSEVEEYVKSCGLYKTKAKEIVKACEMLEVNYGGRIPDEMNELLKLPGIGRKTANLLIGTLYGKPAIVVDTHVIRISNRLGIVGDELFLKASASSSPLNGSPTAHTSKRSGGITPAGTANPVKIENALRKLLPEAESLNFCHRLVFLGREVCKAKKPNCKNCVLKNLCPKIY